MKVEVLDAESNKKKRHGTLARAESNKGCIFK